MKEFHNQLQIELSNQEDLVNYFAKAIQLREQHRDQSEEIARQVFDNTHPALLSFEVNDRLQKIRNEFGALEAPGLLDNDSDPDAYRDDLWRRLKNLINKRGTV